MKKIIFILIPITFLLTGCIKQTQIGTERIKNANNVLDTFNEKVKDRETDTTIKNEG